MPQTDIIHMEPRQKFMDWSAPDATGGGNVPEARQIWITGGDEGGYRYNPWNDNK